MPDITMCLSKVCKMREKCYRFTATPSEWQFYLADETLKYPDCNLYIEAISKRQVRRLDSQAMEKK